MNHNLLTVLFTGLLWIASSFHGVAQDPYAYVSSDSITVGDRFGLVIVVPHASDAHVARPIFRAPTGASTIRYGDLIIFKSLSSGQKDLPNSTVPVADTLVYEAATFALDTAFVPPLRLTLVQGGDSTRIVAGGFEFPVVSLIDETMEDILDISEIASFPAAIWPWLLLAAVLAALFIAVRFRDKFVGDKEPAPVEEPEVIPDPPYEEAKKRFVQLEEKDFDATRVKEYFVELTDIIRVYLSRRIEIPALESTSSELLDDLGDWTAQQNYDQPFGDRLMGILTMADLAKFADDHPAEELCIDALTKSRKLVAEIEDLVNLKEKQARAEAARAAAADENAQDDDFTDPTEEQPTVVEGEASIEDKTEASGYSAEQTEQQAIESGAAAEEKADALSAEDDWERFKPK